MARQTFEVGQRVAIRHQGSYGISDSWYAAIVTNPDTTSDYEHGHLVRVRYAGPDSFNGSKMTLYDSTVPNRRDRITATVDQVSLTVGPDRLDRIIADFEQKDKERKEGIEQRERDNAANLERGWKRLHEALGNHTDGAIVTAFNILEPLIDTDALRRYGAKEAVSA